MDLYIGNQTAFFTADPEEPFSFAQEHGFDAFEWFDDKKYYDNGHASGWTYADADPKRQHALKALAAAGLRQSVHAAWQARPHSPEGAAKINEAVTFAAAIGAKVVVLHLQKDAPPAVYAQALAPLARQAYNQGVRLAVENTPADTPEDFAALFACLKKENALPATGMCLDIGHANINETTRHDFIRFIDQLPPAVEIIHCHAHSNWGYEDEHLPLFAGPFAKNALGVELFLNRLKERGFSGAIILEQWPQPPETLLEIEARLRELSGCPRHSLSAKKKSAQPPTPPPTATATANVKPAPITLTSQPLPPPVKLANRETAKIIKEKTATTLETVTAQTPATTIAPPAPTPTPPTPAATRPATPAVAVSAPTLKIAKPLTRRRRGLPGRKNASKGQNYLRAGPAQKLPNLRQWLRGWRGKWSS